MEQLNAKQQEKITKMLDARLVSSLTKAGVSADEIEAMNRPTMIERWAKLVVAGVNKPQATGAAAGGPKAEATYDPELEREKLALEKYKLEVQA